MRRLLFALIGFCAGLAIDMAPTIVANHYGVRHGCAEGCPNVRNVAILLYLLIPCTLSVAICIAAWDRAQPIKKTLLAKSVFVTSLTLFAFLALTGLR